MNNKSEKKNGRSWWVIILIIAIISIIIYKLFPRTENTVCDEAKVDQYINKFTKVLMNVEYPTSGKNYSCKIKNCRLKKGIYTIDADTKWTGNECDISPNGICEVNYSVRVHFYEDGKLYGYSITNKNACAMQHEVCKTAIQTTLKLIQDAYDNQQ